ncbi:hypothetical protein KH990_08075 [Methanoculleus bourgensis]|jgi:hypothetical protein|uniref:hypothetical protein n=1 Tax=Methanoculleus TaxID=45989 RepID=UPI0015D2F001|nr:MULTISPECIES: hypothetical protein [Methanoculleus]MBT0733323.1 hypothetical protein [Methanoculleus bourgensis]
MFGIFTISIRYPSYPDNPCEFIYVSTEGELSSEEGKSYQAIPLLIVETSVKHGERPD